MSEELLPCGLCGMKRRVNCHIGEMNYVDGSSRICPNWEKHLADTETRPAPAASDAEVANKADAWAIAEWQHGYAAGFRAEKSEIERSHKQRCKCKAAFRAALRSALAQARREERERAAGISAKSGYLQGLTMALTIAQQHAGGQAFKRGAALRIAEKIEAAIAAGMPAAAIRADASQEKKS